jgi:hypothetical protein
MPPMAGGNHLAMESPSPAPPVALARDASCTVKPVNNLRDELGVMPIPSPFRKARRGVFAPAATVIWPPASVYLIALSTRIGAPA